MFKEKRIIYQARKDKSDLEALQTALTAQGRAFSTLGQRFAKGAKDFKEVLLKTGERFKVLLLNEKERKKMIAEMGSLVLTESTRELSLIDKQKTLHQMPIDDVEFFYFSEDQREYGESIPEGGMTLSIFEGLLLLVGEPVGEVLKRGKERRKEMIGYDEGGDDFRVEDLRYIMKKFVENKLLFLKDFHAEFEGFLETALTIEPGHLGDYEKLFSDYQFEQKFEAAFRGVEESELKPLFNDILLYWEMLLYVDAVLRWHLEE